MLQWFCVNLLNGVSVGLLLFMLSAGLTLIFSMLSVLNFAHASFYMLGAYVGQALASFGGFWFALILAPLIVGAVGAMWSDCFYGACMGAVRSPICCSPSARPW